MPSVAYLSDEIEIPTTPLLGSLAGSTGMIQNKKIFRAGTFKDSLGRERTWSVADLKAIAANYQALRQSNIFPSVPVRIDHSWSARDVVGWIESVWVDGEYLMANLAMTEPDAFNKWQRGTLGPVSSEIGPYETNDGDTFSPVLLGLAFVDIPAVEGLYRNAGAEPPAVLAVRIQAEVLDSTQQSAYNRAGQEDDRMTTTTQTIPQGAPSAPAPVADLPGATGGNAPAVAVPSNGAPAPGGVAPGAHAVPATPAVTPPAPAVPQVVDPATGQPVAAVAPAPVAPQAPAPQAVLPPPAPAPVAPQTQVEQVPAGAAQAYRINGQVTTEAMAIQGHIDQLERFKSDAVKLGRETFVDSLVHGNKIVAQQGVAMKAAVATMDDAQFAAFRSVYEGAAPAPILSPEVSAQAAQAAQFGYAQVPAPAPQVPAAAPVQPVLGFQGAQAGQSPQGAQFGAGGHDPVAAEIATLDEILEHHRASGKTPEQIAETKSFKRRQELAAGRTA